MLYAGGVVNRRAEWKPQSTAPALIGEPKPGITNLSIQNAPFQPLNAKEPARFLPEKKGLPATEEIDRFLHCIPGWIYPRWRLRSLPAGRQDLHWPARRRNSPRPTSRSLLRLLSAIQTVLFTHQPSKSSDALRCGGWSLWGKACAGWSPHANACSIPYSGLPH